MRLSCNFIQGHRVMEKSDTKVITTEYQMQNNEEKNDNISYEQAEYLLNNYEKIGQEIIEDAKKKKDEIIYEAMEKVQEIEKDAYEKGYSQGLKNGEEDGRKEAYDTYVPQAQVDAQNIKDNADKLFLCANENYNKYLNDKKNDVLDLAITIAEQILHRELKSKDSLNELVEEAIRLSKGEENIVVKCNEMYEEELKKNVPMWKATNNIPGEIFIIVDNDIEEGNAIIQKNSGKILVGIDVGLKKIKDAILS